MGSLELGGCKLTDEGGNYMVSGLMVIATGIQAMETVQCVRGENMIVNIK